MTHSSWMDKNCENRSNFSTFFIRNEMKTDSLSRTVNKFWEIEEFPKSDIHQIKPEESYCLEKMESSIKYKNGHYEVSVPWKDSKIVLPNNYSQTFIRLENTEKRLLRHPDAK